MGEGQEKNLQAGAGKAPDSAAKKSFFVTANGLRFHVQTIGSGTPLVMIMGLGSPGDKWRRNYELLSHFFTCVIPDNRGAGESDKPEAAGYTTDEMSDDILGIMDALGIEKAHVMGVSMGGAIAQMVALKAPEKVISLVLTSTFASVSETFRKILTIWCALREENVSSDVMKQLGYFVSSGQMTQNHHPETIDSFIREDAALSPMPLYAYKAQCRACLTHDTSRRLGELKMPVLIAAGARDLYMNPEKTKELRDGIPQAEFYLAPEGGHVHQWEYGEVYNSVVLGFLIKQDMAFRGKV